MFSQNLERILRISMENFDMNRVEMKRLQKDIDDKAEKLIKRMEEKGLIAAPYKGNTHSDDYSFGRRKGFSEGIQHAINCIFQMQQNTSPGWEGSLQVNYVLARLEKELVIAKAKEE